jgi:hypothetical protein
MSSTHTTSRGPWTVTIGFLLSIVCSDHSFPHASYLSACSSLLSRVRRRTSTSKRSVRKRASVGRIYHSHSPASRHIRLNHPLRKARTHCSNRTNLETRLVISILNTIINFNKWFRSWQPKQSLRERLLNTSVRTFNNMAKRDDMVSHQHPLSGPVSTLSPSVMSSSPPPSPSLQKGSTKSSKTWSGSAVVDSHDPTTTLPVQPYIIANMGSPSMHSLARAMSSPGRPRSVVRHALSDNVSAKGRLIQCNQTHMSLSCSQ